LIITPELILDNIKIQNSTGLTARVFSRALGLLPKDRKKLEIRIDKELLLVYESKYPRTNNQKFHGASISDDINKALAVWMRMHNDID
jgi:hypothetical protein